MGQLESLRKLNIAQPKNKKEKISMPLMFIPMGISVNLEILRHCTLELFGSFIYLCASLLYTFSNL
jgi:hypothetical protein